jgi:hypothetical protein
VLELHELLPHTNSDPRTQTRTHTQYLSCTSYYRTRTQIHELTHSIRVARATTAHEVLPTNSDPRTLSLSHTTHRRKATKHKVLELDELLPRTNSGPRTLNQSLAAAIEYIRGLTSDSSARPVISIDIHMYTLIYLYRYTTLLPDL